MSITTFGCLHGAYSLVVKLGFVEPVSRVRFSLGTQDRKMRTAPHFLILG